MCNLDVILLFNMRINIKKHSIHIILMAHNTHVWPLKCSTIFKKHWCSIAEKYVYKQQ